MAFHPNDTDTRHNDARYRLYVRDGGVEVWAVCVQYFDYVDYSGVFLPGWFDDRDEAETAAEQTTTAWEMAAKEIAAQAAVTPVQAEIDALDQALAAFDDDAPGAALPGVQLMRDSLERRRAVLVSGR